MPWGKRVLRKVFVSRPLRRTLLPCPKRHKVGVTPEKLDRSSRFRGGAASSSAHPSSPDIIELDEEEVEATEVASQPPYDSQDRN